MTGRRLNGRELGLPGLAVALSEATDWRGEALEQLGLVRWEPGMGAVPVLEGITADLTARRWVLIERSGPREEPTLLVSGLFTGPHPIVWERLVHHGGGLLLAVHDSAPEGQMPSLWVGVVRAHVGRATDMTPPGPPVYSGAPGFGGTPSATRAGRMTGGVRGSLAGHAVPVGGDL